MDKASIRKLIRNKKEALSAFDKEQAAVAVFSKIENLIQYHTATKILLYNSLPDELPTKPTITKWDETKQIFLPRVNGDSLDILPFNKNEIKRGAFNIEEPTGNNICNVDDIDLIIVPAIAFDHLGNRVGRGKGYYDRLLANAHALKIGVGYDFQLLDNTIPANPHDIAVDIIITPNNNINLTSTWH